MSRRPRVVVLDYGSGNLRSAQRALQRAGADAEISADQAAALAADGLVVPGVGAFAACMTGLLAVGGDQVIAKRIAAGRPVLGICVGMQILFEAGDEHGVRTPGCGLWPAAGPSTSRSTAGSHPRLQPRWYGLAPMRWCRGPRSSRAARVPIAPTSPRSAMRRCWRAGRRHDDQLNEHRFTQPLCLDTSSL